MADGDDVWAQLQAAADALTQLSTDTVRVWPYRRRRLLCITEGLDAGDKWVYGLTQPVRWRRPLSDRWHELQPVEAAVSRLQDFLLERPDHPPLG